MSTMIAEVYDALVDAGASDDKAKAAATAVANYEDRLTETNSAIKELEKRMKLGFAKVNGEIRILKWMLGLVIAGIASLILKTFFI